MYLDGVRSNYKDVLKTALAEYKTLDEMKSDLAARFGKDRVTFKVE
jgi:hypothetical protein